MNELARRARNQYQRELRAKNKEREKAYREAYWLRKAKEMGLTEGDTTEKKKKG